MYCPLKTPTPHISVTPPYPRCHHHTHLSHCPTQDTTTHTCHTTLPKTPPPPHTCHTTLPKTPPPHTCHTTLPKTPLTHTCHTTLPKTPPPPHTHCHIALPKIPPPHTPVTPPYPRHHLHTHLSHRPPVRSRSKRRAAGPACSTPHQSPRLRPASPPALHVCGTTCSGPEAVTGWVSPGSAKGQVEGWDSARPSGNPQRRLHWVWHRFCPVPGCLSPPWGLVRVLPALASSPWRAVGFLWFWWQRLAWCLRHR